MVRSLRKARFVLLFILGKTNTVSISVILSVAPIAEQYFRVRVSQETGLRRPGDSQERCPDRSRKGELARGFCCTGAVFANTFVCLRLALVFTHIAPSYCLPFFLADGNSSGHAGQI